MNILTKSSLIFILVFLMMVSCVNSQNKGSVNEMNEMEFIELQRFNTDAELPEISILRTGEDIKNLYKSLHNSKYSRSAPIPVLEENEALLVIKLKLKTSKYGDINVSKLEEKNGNVTLSYNEIENWEYSEKKQSNPVLIIKIFQRPKSIIIKHVKM